MRIVVGTAHPALGKAIAERLGEEPVHAELERFPDGEIRPIVAAVGGDDVYVVQPTCPPVNEHLVELLLLVDACRRAGASRVTAVVPYFGYARQDRRSQPGEPIGARVVADLIAAAGADRLVVVDPHATGLEAICPVPAVVLTALPTLADALGDRVGPGAVVVAPDLGAVKLAERLAARFGLPVAVVRKSRTSNATVRSADLVGRVEGRATVIVDDMIATGATIEAAADLLAAGGAIGRPVVVATHGLFVGDAPSRLERLGLAAVLVTDTVPPPGDRPEVEVCSVAPLLADAIGRLHRDGHLDDLGLFL